SAMRGAMQPTPGSPSPRAAPSATERRSQAPRARPRTKVGESERDGSPAPARPTEDPASVGADERDVTPGPAARAIAEDDCEREQVHDDRAHHGCRPALEDEHGQPSARREDEPGQENARSHGPGGVAGGTQ